MSPQTNIAPNPDRAHLDFLAETVAGNLHVHALEVVTIAACVAAAARSGEKSPLRSRRHLLHSGGKAMPLALKFGGEIGLSPALVERLNALFASVLAGKAALSAVIAAKGGHTQAQLQGLSNFWRRAAGETLKAVELFDQAAKGSLNAVYAEDTRAVRHVLQKAVDGSEILLDDFGSIVLPRLNQRRQSPRLAVQRTGTLHSPAGAAQVRIQDMSCKGLGIFCDQPLAAQQRISVTLDNGTTVEAVVMSARGSFFGLSLLTPLSQKDILS